MVQAGCRVDSQLICNHATTLLWGGLGMDLSSLRVYVMPNTAEEVRCQGGGSHHHCCLGLGLWSLLIGTVLHKGPSRCQLQR